MSRASSRKRILGPMAGTILSLVVSAPLWCEASPPGQPVAAGQSVPELRLKDQHDRAGQVDADTRLLLFAPDREGSDIAHAVLDALGGETLARAGVRYVADISAMPALVTRLLALPKMRDYTYSVLLGREAADTAFLPRRAGQITLLGLDAGTVTEVGYIDSIPALRARLAPYLAVP